MRFTAEWTAPKYAEAYPAPGKYSVEVPAGISRVVAYIVGGGGSGGSYYVGDSRPVGKVYAGGGGGSGQVTIHEFRNLIVGQTINITVGSGGLYEADGGASCVDIGYNPVYANGGLKGANAAKGVAATGGAQYNKGGSSTNKTDGVGEDGAATEGLGIAGKGAATLNEKGMGGGGGGAADLNCTIANFTNTVGEGEISKDVDVGWWFWDILLEDKFNCEASCSGVSGSLGQIRLKCTPTSNGFFMYRVVIRNSYDNARKDYMISGIKAESEGASMTATFQSKGGDSAGHVSDVTMGRLGGGGSSSSAYVYTGKPIWLAGSVPGGAGCVILAYVE